MDFFCFGQQNDTNNLSDDTTQPVPMVKNTTAEVLHSEDVAYFMPQPQIQSANSANFSQNDMSLNRVAKGFKGLTKGKAVPVQLNFQTSFSNSGDVSFDDTNSATKECEGNHIHSVDPQSYSFPDGGWACSKCHNYNFKGRKFCNRCKKSKS